MPPMKPPANDDAYLTEPCISVTLHARYLLALKNHRRQAFTAGVFVGVVIAMIVPRIIGWIGRFA
jgi:hypothetical protein